MPSRTIALYRFLILILNPSRLAPPSHARLSTSTHILALAQAGRAWAPLSAVWRKLMMAAKDTRGLSSKALLLQDVAVLEEAMNQGRSALSSIHLAGLFCLPSSFRASSLLLPC